MLLKVMKWLESKLFIEPIEKRKTLYFERTEKELSEEAVKNYKFQLFTIYSFAVGLVAIYLIVLVKN
ncbi:hypothetical protein [Sporosarcina sp. BP05]|uniref:hypothetical protein n=1 Tax=Sporosarcina sp. BP05 TaxID=2758726 RepID=UPI0016446FF0|nr:hypothetical protein [Sporosarcina sp. BP05]